MSKLVKTLFGGTDSSSQDAQIEANALVLAFTEEKGAEAKQAAESLFGRAQESTRRGFQAGLNVLGQTIPQQASTFQQGNVGAQQALLAGLPQIQAALLGETVDFSQLRSKQLDFDPRFAQQVLPQAPAGAATSFGTGGAGLPQNIIDIVNQGFNLPPGADGESPGPQGTAPPPAAGPGINSLIDDIIAQVNAGTLTQTQGANRIIDQAQGAGLTAEQLASGSPAITLENVLQGLQLTNRSL